MAKSECRQCIQYSCESLVVKQEDGTYAKDITRRFRFIKEDGVICDGGAVENSIENCEIKARAIAEKEKIIEIDPNKIEIAIKKKIKAEKRKKSRERKRLARLGDLA